MISSASQRLNSELMVTMSGNQNHQGIKMPGMDGLALLAQVQERHPDTLVILISGHSDHQLAIQALRGGAYDYILKPIDRDDFVASLSRALHTHQLHQQVAEEQRTLERYALSREHMVEQRTRELAAANKATEEVLQALVDLHGGHIEVQNEPGSEKKLSVVMPFTISSAGRRE